MMLFALEKMKKAHFPRQICEEGFYVTIGVRMVLHVRKIYARRTQYDSWNGGT